MNQAIKTISLDDVGETQVAADPQQGLHYSPQYVSGSITTQGGTARDALSQTATAIGRSEETSMFGTALTRMSEFFGDVEDAKKTRLYFLVGGLAFVLGAAFFWFNEQNSSPEMTDTPASEIEKDFAQAESKTTPKVETVVPTPELSKSKTDPLINPYWSLPNPLETETLGEAGLSQSQEERWRYALNHPFAYQRYKVIQDIRRARLKGSEFLLSEALSQPKFWTRMEALLAMAELGEEVDINTVEGAIGNTRRPLVQNYFRRFNKKASASELYVMRQAVRVVDATARTIILKSLASRRNATNDLYLIAASRDPNEKVKSWAEAELKAKPPTAETLAAFDKVLAGENQAEAPKPGEPGQEATQVDESGQAVNVEEVYFLNEEASPALKSAPEATEGFEPQEGDASETAN